MKKLLSLFTALPLMAILMFSSLTFADTGDIVVEGKPVVGKIEVGGGTLELPNSDTLPGTCAVGDTYVLTSTFSGQQCYVCESTDVWVSQGSFYSAAYYPDYNEADQGVTGNGESAKAYIDTISTDSASLVFRHNSGAVTTTYTFSTNETIPDNINVVREKGAILSIANGVTLTIEKMQNSEPYQGFDLVGTGKVTFGAGAVKEVYPEWFGDIDGTADEVQINAALDSLPIGPTAENQLLDYTDGGTVKLSRRNWGIDAPIVMDSFQRLLGSGASTIIVNSANDTAAITIGGDLNRYAIRVVVENLSIEGAGTAYNVGGYGIHGYAVMKSYIKNIWINHCTDSAIYLQGSSYTYIQNIYLEDNRGYGVHLVGIIADDYLWTTSTHIESSSIKYSGKAGIKLVNALKTYINHNTIEANGIIIPEQLGIAGTLTPASYFMNIYSLESHSSIIKDNYFEHVSSYGTALTRVNLALSGTQANKITDNSFVTDVGIYIWASADQAPWYNYIVRNIFDFSTDDNLVIQSDATASAVYYNTIQDNLGLRFKEKTDAPYKSYWERAGFGDSNRHGHTAASVGTETYTPDMGITDSAALVSGKPKPHIFIITLTGNAIIATPTPAGIVDFYVTYIFIQDAGGGNTVTFGVNYKNEWSNVGNIGDKRSSITFYGPTSGVMYQIGKQSGYY